jgi:hypothetical protein
MAQPYHKLFLVSELGSVVGEQPAGADDVGRNHTTENVEWVRFLCDPNNHKSIQERAAGVATYMMANRI